MSNVKSSEKGDKKDQVESSLNTDAATETKEQAPSTEFLQILKDLQEQINILKSEKKAPEATIAAADDYDILEDYMEYPAVFFSFSSEYAIHSDKRSGKESFPPNREFVKFKKLYRYSRKGAGRAVETVAVSQATIRSKATTEWLRKHSLFGIKFFENINDVKSVDVTLAEKMAESAARVSGMSDMQVIERCKSEGMGVHSDLDKLRKELIQKLAKQSIQKVKLKQEMEFKAERDDNNRKVEYRDAGSAGSASTDIY